MDAGSTTRKRSAADAGLPPAATARSGEVGGSAEGAAADAPAPSVSEAASATAAASAEMSEVAAAAAAERAALEATVAASLAAIEEERASLVAGKHAAFLTKAAVFESARADSLARAIIQRRMQEETLAQMHEYQKYAAEKICEDSKKRLIGLMMQELDERARRSRARLLVGLDAAKHERDRAGAARKLRSKTKGDETGAGGDDASAPGATSSQSIANLLDGRDPTVHSRADVGLAVGMVPAAAGAYIMLGVEGMPPPLALALPPKDILEDLTAIYRDWKATAQRWRVAAASALVPVRVEKGRLYIGSGEPIAKNDAVSVFSELPRQEFAGVMHALATNEVVVRLSDGTKARVPLQHLRHGRVSLHRLGGPQAAGDDGASAAAAAARAVQPPPPPQPQAHPARQRPLLASLAPPHPAPLPPPAPQPARSIASSAPVAPAPSPPSPPPPPPPPRHVAPSAVLPPSSAAVVAESASAAAGEQASPPPPPPQSATTADVTISAAAGPAEAAVEAMTVTAAATTADGMDADEAVSGGVDAEAGRAAAAVAASPSGSKRTRRGVPSPTVASSPPPAADQPQLPRKS